MVEGAVTLWATKQLGRLISTSWVTGPNGPDADRMKLENHCRRGANGHPTQWIREMVATRQVLRVAVDLCPAGAELALVLFTSRTRLASRTFLIDPEGDQAKRRKLLMRCLLQICNACGAVFQVSDDTGVRNWDASCDSPRRRMRE